jgi:hypothetical protein
MAKSGIDLKPAPTIFILSEIKFMDDSLTKIRKGSLQQRSAIIFHEKINNLQGVLP